MYGTNSFMCNCIPILTMHHFISRKIKAFSNTCFIEYSTSNDKWNERFLIEILKNIKQSTLKSRTILLFQPFEAFEKLNIIMKKCQL